MDVRLNGRRAGVELTPAGREQAQALVHQFHHIELEAIYTSPRERTRSTSEPLSRHTGLPVRELMEFDEINFGEWTGCTFDSLHGLPEWKQFNSRRSQCRIPGGEGYDDLRTRIQSGLEMLKNAHPHGRIAVFTHADVIRTAVMTLLGAPPDRLLQLEISPGSVTIFQLHDPLPRLLGLNITPPPLTSLRL